MYPPYVTQGYTELYLPTHAGTRMHQKKVIPTYTKTRFRITSKTDEGTKLFQISVFYFQNLFQKLFQNGYEFEKF